MSFAGYHDFDVESSVRRIILAEQGRTATRSECKVWVRDFIRVVFAQHLLGKWHPGMRLEGRNAVVVGREFEARLQRATGKS